MSLIGRFEHLVKRPRASEANDLLLKVSSLVKPIMKAHSWTVGTLAEFVPGNPGLLGMNMNKGAKILLRLRPAGAEDTFYDVEQLVLVMLHELTHNVHGPHDASFYKLLEKLEEEYYELKRKGYSGDGFQSNGARLGGSHGVPEHIGKIKALEAAEKRVAKQRMMGKGGRLGGAGEGVQGKSMREVLAQAAERRIKDDKSCVHVESAAADEEARKAAAESEGVDARDLPGPGGEAGSAAPVLDEQIARPPAQTAQPKAAPLGSASQPIDVESDDEPDSARSQANEGGIKVKSDREAVLASSRPVETFPSALADTAKEATSLSKTSVAAKATALQDPTKRRRISPPAPAPKPVAPASCWSCAVCTLINPSSAKRCDACGSPQPRDETRGWWCDVCLEFGNAHDRWMCLSCGSIKRSG